MTLFPDEIWSDILDYLDPQDLVSSQGVSPQLLRLARDPTLWRKKVFEKAPSAAHSHATSPNALSSLTGALGVLSLGGCSRRPPVRERGSARQTSPSKASQKAMAILEWDRSHPSEEFDWYSEYIARHAPLSAVWDDSVPSQQEVRGMALLGDGEKVIGTLEDGSLGIWDIQQPHQGQRKPVQVAKSRSGMLFDDMYSLGESSLARKTKPLGANIENISVDSKKKRVFCAVENLLNEVDLERMEVISQTKSAWPITALSQEGEMDCDLTVGTSFSLHIHDMRMPLVTVSDHICQVDNLDDSKIAFLENYGKSMGMGIKHGTEKLSEVANGNDFEHFSSNTNRIEAYGCVKPGPQSILHRGDHEIVIAGRMPSILFYDRRNFPQPRNAIHSGARLSALTTLPVPPSQASIPGTADSTLIACGEYGGRGSLEIYELPWERSPSTDGSSSPSTEPYSFKNRQEASSSKLLSVATQGTRIVFTDSEGMLKWVERDGRGLVRRWNINAYQMNQRGGNLCGDKVVRKIIPLPAEPSERGTRGDGDLLVWTGEKIGVITTKPKPGNDHAELVRAFERGMNLNDRDEESQTRERDVHYSTMMRRALERQADERRWMSRFGGRRW